MENTTRTNFVAFAKTQMQEFGAITTQQQFENLVENLFKQLNNFGKFSSDKEQEEQKDQEEQEEQGEQGEQELVEQVLGQEVEEQEREFREFEEIWQEEQFLRDQGEVGDKMVVDYGEDERMVIDNGENERMVIDSPVVEQVTEQEDEVLQCRKGKFWKLIGPFRPKL